jgi:ribosomal protein L11 methyltransferase
MDYIVYHFTTEPKEIANEILIALLGEYPFESFAETEIGFDAFIQKELDAGLEIELAVLDGISYRFVKDKIEDENWNAKWEENFDAVEIPNKLTIRAPFHHKPEASLLDIIVLPKMSFGTGHHSTTYMMSEALFDMDLNQKSLLDMGCGTGVLAIIAAKKGASSIDAIDIDDWCVENTQENCRLNQAEQIKIYKGDATAIINQYDVIAANINKNVLKKDLSTYHTHLNSHGSLLISGFFITDVEELIQLGINAGFKHETTITKGDWAMVRFNK